MQHKHSGYVVLGDEITTEIKPGFIQYKKTMRVKGTIMNSSKERTTKADSQNWICRLKMTLQNCCGTPEQTLRPQFLVTINKVALSESCLDVSF
jgi:hypothetical protein